MTEPSTSAALPPAWIRKRDGRLVPFEADRISRSLFAAAEGLGKPDAFLARELTDGILHFLAAELEDATPTTAQLAELVVKVVRELGQPALARAFAEYRDRQPEGTVEEATDFEPAPPIVLRVAAGVSLQTALRDSARECALQTVFSRDLQSAHRDGLLRITGLEAPLKLASVLLGFEPGEGRLLAALAEARQVTGEFVVLDGPEYQLLRSDEEPANAVAQFVRELEIGLSLSGLRAVINLNAATPPPWADDLADGPLFSGRARAESREIVERRAQGIVEVFSGRNSLVSIDWHLGERDLQGRMEGALPKLIRRALAGEPLTFVLDRPRRPVALAEGMDRRHAALLLTVGVSLPRLAEQLDVGATASQFVEKLGSLARLALSTARQKREFLRGQAANRPALTRGFLLDRARVAIAPLGLATVARRFTGRGLCEAEGLKCALEVIGRLADVLRQDGGHQQLDACLDGSAEWFAANEATGAGPGLEGGWDESADARTQLRTAGAIQGVSGAGTAGLVLAADAEPALEEVIGWLRWAWKHTEIVRLRLVRGGGAHKQLTLDQSEARDENR